MGKILRLWARFCSYAIAVVFTNVRKLGVNVWQQGMEQLFKVNQPNTRAKIKDPEEVINKMYGCNIDTSIGATLSGFLICTRVYPCPYGQLVPTLVWLEQPCICQIGGW